MADGYAGEHEDSRSRHINDAAWRQENVNSTGDTLGVKPALLGNHSSLTAIRGRGNAEVRASAMQQAQLVHGNRAVQRLVRQGGPREAVAVQRTPWDWEPTCPPVLIGPQLPQVGCKPRGGGGGSAPAKEPPVSHTPQAPPHKKGKRAAPGKGKKGGKAGDADSQGGFTITLEELQKRTGLRIPILPSDDDILGPRHHW